MISGTAHVAVAITGVPAASDSSSRGRFDSSLRAGMMTLIDAAALGAHLQVVVMEVILH